MIKSNYKQFGTLFLLVLVICFTLFGACRKANNYVWLSYDETQCADAWTGSTNNETLKNNIVDYFDHKGITIYDSEIFVVNPSEPFNSCQSKTGRQIKCKIKEQKVSDLKAYGFYE